MIGLLFGLLHVSVRGFNIGKGLYNERKNLKKAINDGSDYYVDINGMTRRVCDDQLTVTTKDQYGDIVKINPINGHIYRNLGLEKRKEYERSLLPEKEKAISNNKKTYLFDKNVLSRPHYPEMIACLNNREHKYKNQIIKGEIWRHVDTGHLYVKRAIKVLDNSVTKEEQKKYLSNIFESATVYMDLSTGMIIPEIIGWDVFTKEEPSEWSKNKVFKKIEYYNARNEAGIFIHRSNIDQWLNNNLPME